MTVAGAVALTLFLGVVGDLVVLRWPNTPAFSVGHIWLNIGFIYYLVVLYGG